VTGPDLLTLAERLRTQPGVEQAVPFGNTLHVSGADTTALRRAIEPFRSDSYEWREITSGLEDVFIHLMEQHNEVPGGAAA
jgi:ABC-2 type transport system ATP-binding protein